MSIFKPINLTKGVTLFDAYDPELTIEDKRAGLTVFYSNFDDILAVAASSAVDEPGCHTMWRGKDSQKFVEQKSEPNPELSFAAYRDKLLIERVAVGLHGRHHTLLCFDKDMVPLGGVVIYNEEVVSDGPGTNMSIYAHYGPFLSNSDLNVEFLVKLLKQKFQVTDDDGNNQRLVELLAWRHESVERSNRWRTELIFTSRWNAAPVNDGAESGVESVVEVIDGEEVRSSTFLTTTGPPT